MGRLYCIPHVSQLVSWSITSLFSTNMAISETNGHSLQRTPSSPLFSCPGLSPWSSCAQELYEIILFQQADAPGPRLESILGHCERHALLHMASKWFDHWTTWGIRLVAAPRCCFITYYLSAPIFQMLPPSMVGWTVGRTLRENVCGGGSPSPL